MKTHLRTAQLLGALTALIALASPAQAVDSVFGTSVVSNLRYTLTDLNPNDGIAPTLTWTSTNARLSGYHDGSVFEEFGDGSSPLYRNWTSGADVIVAELQNGATFNNARLSTYFHSDGSTADINASAARSNFGFTLSAGTAVTFYEDYAMSIDTHNAAASTYGWMYAIMELSETGNSQDYFDSSFVEAATYGNRNLSGTGTVSFKNTSASSWTGNLFVQASGQGFAGPLPVPEPSTYAMLLAGLALLGSHMPLKRYWKR